MASGSRIATPHPRNLPKTIPLKRSTPILHSDKIVLGLSRKHSLFCHPSYLCTTDQVKREKFEARINLN